MKRADKKEKYNNFYTDVSYVIIKISSVRMLHNNMRYYKFIKLYRSKNQSYNFNRKHYHLLEL